MARTIKTVALTLLIVWGTICIVGPKFDEICIEGQLSQVQADAINELPWKTCPSYRGGECQADFEDRVIIRECSEASRSTFLWWKKVNKWVRKNWLPQEE